MPRQISFVPFRDKSSGRWLIYLPSEGARAADGRKRGRRKSFKTRSQALEYAEPLKAALKNGQLLPNDEVSQYENLETLVMMAGYSDLPAFVNEMLELEGEMKESDFPMLRDAIEHIKQNNITNAQQLTVAKLLHLREINFPNWDKEDQYNFTSECRDLLMRSEERSSIALGEDGEGNGLSPEEVSLLVKDLPETPAASLDSVFWNEWLKAYRASPFFTSVRRYNGMLKNLKGAYAQALSTGQILLNPVAEIRSMKNEEKVPEIVTPEQLRQLLKLCAKHHPEWVPYFILLFYTGCRSGKEAESVAYKHLLTEAETLKSIIIPRPETLESRVKVKKTKTKKTRIVELQPCVHEWLSPFLSHHDRETRLHPVKLNRKAETVPDKNARQKARTALFSGEYNKGDILLNWGSRDGSVARHSYATYLEAMHGHDAGIKERIERELGHSWQTFETHYQNDTVFRSTAQEYLSIFPDEKDLKNIAKHLKSL